jgi:hypothetical protein
LGRTRATSSSFGSWIDGPSVPRDPATGRPVVFVARSTHAMYPAAGCWPRVFCLGNDHARASRAMWDPVDALMPIGNPDAVRTDLGDGHMQWHAQTDELVGAPRGRRAAALYRLFYPLSAHKA